MQMYMERTEKQRENERKRTDEYIMTRRDISRTKYNEKSADFILDIGLSNEKLVYESQYAPMVIFELSSNEIMKTSALASVEKITAFSFSLEATSDEFYDINTTSETDAEVLQQEVADTNTIKNVIGYTKLVEGLKNTLNYTLDGTGVVIGTVERRGHFDTNTHEFYSADINFVDAVDQTSEYNKHLETTTRVMVGSERGLAPSSKVYCSNITLLGVEQLIQSGVQLINISEYYSPWAISNSYEYYIGWTDWADHIVAQHGVTIVAAVGNTVSDTFNPKGYIYPPASGYNVIGVAAYQIGHEIYEDGSTQYTYTLDKSDDIMTMSSAYTDAYSGNTGAQKPDVIMPAPPAGGATSLATPILTSSIALMFQLKPSLSVYPQAVKAIVLASCHRKVLSSFNGEPDETIYDGITSRQGAGAPDVFAMASIVCQGTYGVGRIKENRNQAIRRFMLPDNDSLNANVSITWLMENNYSTEEDHENETGLHHGDVVNLSLSVYRNGMLVGQPSDLSNSSTEMLYFELDSTKTNYEIRINESETYLGTVRYGYAYCTDKPYMAPATEDGIYYIRNYYTDNYLTLDTVSNEIIMTSFTGNDNQKWIIRQRNTGGYEIYPGYSNVEGKINFGSQVGNNPYYKSIIGSSNLDLNIFSWETDSTLEPDAYVFTSTSDGNHNIMSYTYSTGVFVRSTNEPTVNMHRMWVLEDINYRQGDANMDGVLNVQDATYIGTALAASDGIDNFSNLQIVLCDADYSGSINVKDVTRIQKIVAQMYLY